MALFLPPGRHLCADLGILLACYPVQPTSCSLCLMWGSTLTVGLPLPHTQPLPTPVMLLGPGFLGALTHL